MVTTAFSGMTMIVEEKGLSRFSGRPIPRIVPTTALICGRPCGDVGDEGEAGDGGTRGVACSAGCAGTGIVRGGCIVSIVRPQAFARSSVSHAISVGPAEVMAKIALALKPSSFRYAPTRALPAAFPAGAPVVGSVEADAGIALESSWLAGEPDERTCACAHA